MASADYGCSLSISSDFGSKSKKPGSKKPGVVDPDGDKPPNPKVLTKASIIIGEAKIVEVDGQRDSYWGPGCLSLGRLHKKINNCYLVKIA